MFQTCYSTKLYYILDSLHQLKLAKFAGRYFSYVTECEVSVSHVVKDDSVQPDDRHCGRSTFAFDVI